MIFQFHSIVKNVEPKTSSDGAFKWSLTYENLKEKRDYTDTFDVVIVANGHFAATNIPKIPGVETFRGIMIHSHQYRVPEAFSGKKVCVLGAGFSGKDIAAETSRVAEKV